MYFYDPSKLVLSKERDRSEEKSERKQRLRSFNICMKEYCHWHPVVIQHDKLKRECHYTRSQERKQRCHIQNRTQESQYNLARVFNPLPSKPNTNTGRTQRCWLVLCLTLRTRRKEIFQEYLLQNETTTKIPYIK